MSIFPVRLQEGERLRRAHNFFETHRLLQLRTYYPETSLFDASQCDIIDCWSDPPFLLNKLRDLLPFGKVTYQWDYEDFQNIDLARIAEAAQEQLLYWHLSEATTVNNSPAESILLWTKDDHFWFIHVPPQRQELIRRIRAGERVRYLERFSLNYDQVQVTWQEIRLVTRGTEFHLAIVEGKEFTYKWDSSNWETTLENPDHRLIDPQVYHLPPDTPDDPEILEFAEARAPPPLVETPLPPSSPTSISTESVDGWGEPNLWNGPRRCWCAKEVCDCGYRPDTPPTPPSVVLWAPGNAYLPFTQ